MVNVSKISVILAVLLQACCVFAATYYVSHSGDDGYDGSQSAPFRSIQKAIDDCSGGDTVKIINDSDYRLKADYIGKARTLYWQSKWYAIFTDPNIFAGVDANQLIGKNLFWHNEPDYIQDDGYGYTITEKISDSQVCFNAESHREPNRDPGAGNEQPCYVGDQDEIEIDLDNPNGRLDTNEWITIESNDITNKVTIRSDSPYFDGAGFRKGFFVVDANAYKINSIIFRADVQEELYCIKAENGNTEGIVINDCEFYGFKSSCHLGWINKATVTGNIIETTKKPLHVSGIVLGGTGGVAEWNDVKGMNTSERCVADVRGIVVNVKSKGSVVRNNTVHDFVCTHDAALNWGVAGIEAIGYAILVENNTVYNIQCTPGGAEYNFHGAGILLRILSIGSGNIGICVNNIISNCRKGISVFGDGSVGYLDYNNLYACTTDYIGVSRGEHDIDVNPQFVDPANSDFRLRPGSPCLNAGKPTAGGGFTDIGAWQGVSRSVILPDNCTEWLPMDFNNDCKVDFKDFSIFSQNWLDCNL